MSCFLSVDKNIQKYIGHRLRSINSNNNIIIVHTWFRERDHKKRTLTRMISPSWKSLRRARTKKITTIGRNKVFKLSSCSTRRAYGATGHPFDPSFLLVWIFLFLSFDKGTKCLNRLADVYHNFLRASRICCCCCCCVVAIATANHVERSSSRLSLVLSGYVPPCL